MFAQVSLKTKSDVAAGSYILSLKNLNGLKAFFKERELRYLEVWGVRFISNLFSIFAIYELKF